MQQRANQQWRQMLADYEPPAIDDAIDRELRAFIDDRKNATPDAWY
jgi:trimethylamine--corrinoid protein Co-methyltransferase